MANLTDRFGALELTPELAKLYLRGLFAGVYTTGSLVFRDGNLWDNDGSSEQITWPEDRLVLSALRRNSEVVLTSGKTARAEKLRMPKTAKLAIASRTNDLTGTNLETNENLLLLGELSSLKSAVEILRSKGFTSIQVEFGPTGMREIFDAKSLELLIVSEIGLGQNLLTGLGDAVFRLQIGGGSLSGFPGGVATNAD